MRLAALLARAIAADPDVVSSAAALRLATRGGGEALGLPVGALEVGRPADLIRLRTDDARFTPSVNDAELLGHLVWAGAGYLVTDVWVGGAQVVEGGQCTTIDGDRARAEVGQRARRLPRLVGFPPYVRLRRPGPTARARPATGERGRSRSAARPTSTGAAPTAATGATAATSGSSPRSTSRRCSASATIPSAGPPTAGTARVQAQHGARGKDLVVPVPVGTVVRDRDGAVVCDLDQAGRPLVWPPRAARAAGATRASSPTAGGPRPSPSRARRARSTGSTSSSSSWPTSRWSGSPTPASRR